MLGWLAVAMAADVVLMGDTFVSEPPLPLGDHLAERLSLTVLAERGRTLAQHHDRLGVDVVYQDAVDGELSHWILQENASLASLPETSTIWQQGRDAAVALHREAVSRGAQTWLLSPWASAVGAETMGLEDAASMQARIDRSMRAYAAAMEEATGEPVWIAPAGRALLQAPRWLEEDLYALDGVHLSEVGSAVAACMLAVSLQGFDCYRAPVSQTAGLQASPLAMVVLSDPFDTWPMPWAGTWQGETVVSGAPARPFLRVEEDAIVNGLIVGEPTGAGALQVVEGVTLTTRHLQSSANSQVWVSGRLEVDILESAVQLLGGRVKARVLSRSPTFWDGVVHVEERVETFLGVAGDLEFGPGVVAEQAFALRGNTLTLSAGAPPHFMRSTTLDGLIVVPPTADGVVLSADQLSIDNLDMVGMGSGRTWDVRHDGERWELFVRDLQLYGSTGPVPRSCGTGGPPAALWWVAALVMLRRGRR